MNLKSIFQLGRLFLIMQTGTSFGILAGHVLRLAVAWWCLKETQSAIAFSSLIALSVATEIYLKPFLASLGDHFNRIKFILCCQFIVLLITLFLYLLSQVNYFDIKLVAASLILMSAVTSVREPTIMGLIPDMVAEGEVTKAISSRSALNSIIMMIGPIFATALISVFSINAALFTATGLLILSCIAFFCLYTKQKEQLIDNEVKHIKDSYSWFSKTKGGFRAIYRVKSEFHIALISTMINFTMFPFFSVTIPYWISNVLKLPATFLGAFEVSFGLGLIAGSMYFNKLILDLFGRLYNVVSGFLLLGGSVVAIMSVNNIYLSIIFAFFCGLAFIFINVNLTTLRATATPHNYRTRMSAMAVFMSSLANPFGIIIAGWFISNIGVENFALASGVAVLFIAPLIMCSTDVKKALSLNELDMKGYYEKKYPEAFYK